MSVQKQFASLVQTAAQVRASDLYVMPGEAGYRVFVTQQPVFNH